MVKKLSTLAVIIIVTLALTLTASARQVELRLDEDNRVDGVAAIIYYFSSITADDSGAIDGNVFIGLGDDNVQKSIANEGSLFTEQNKDIFLDEGQASITVDLGATFDDVGGYVGINLWTVGEYGIEKYEFLDASGAVIATIIDGAIVDGGAPPISPAPAPDGDGDGDADGNGAGLDGGNGNVDDDDDKHGAETGIGDVAVASAIALVAAGAVIFSRKRK
ncbi:MAG: hypothetical protein LBC82_00180 [Oscillospiraceae bacterium]|jgi:hypothetical protein|nr:hypothetical protein [Oscillospiraceae bacterium]